MKTVYLILFVLFIYAANAQQNGIKVNDFSDKLSYKTKLDETVLKSNSKGTAPISYSLEQFLPEIGEQGSTPSCVGWSTSYYALTIVNRIEHGKDHPVISPWSSYNRYQTRKYNKSLCEQGCWIEEVLTMLQNEGCPNHKDYSFKRCAIDSSRKEYKNKLFSWNRISNSREQIKSALLYNYPVVIGVKIMRSYEGEHLLAKKYIDSMGILNLNTFQNNAIQTHGHAMCIVGYNDTIAGGAFKIVNSWGKDWGQNGFCWLKYSDLNYISHSFCVQGNYESKTNSEIKNFATGNLNFINTSDSSIFIALAVTDKTNDIITKGWYEILPQQKRIISISDRYSNEIYWAVLDVKGKHIKPDCKSDCKDYFVNMEGAFEFSSSGPATGLSKIGFVKYVPTNKTPFEDLLIEFKEINNKQFAYNKVLKESKDLKKLNETWNGDTRLLDPLTCEVIIENVSSKKAFTVYVIENNKVVKHRAKIRKIKTIKSLKFASFNNATDYLNSNN